MSDGKSKPELFELSSLHPGWRGKRILAMKKPLEEGLALLRARLMNCGRVVFDHVLEFDYDGVVDEKITFIERCAGAAQANATVVSRLDAHKKALLARHPDWSVLRDNALVLNVLPATGTLVPGKFSPQVAACKLGDGTPYNSIYIRLFKLERVDALSLFDLLISLDGIEDELIEYLSNLGG